MESTGQVETEVQESVQLLRAILLLQLREQSEEEERGSIEGLLFRAGFTNKQIVAMTGKAKSTVSTRLKAEGLRD